MIYLDNALEDEQYTNRKVFDTDFKVEEMSNPSKYLVEYQKNAVYEATCV